MEGGTILWETNMVCRLSSQYTCTLYNGQHMCFIVFHDRTYGWTGVEVSELQSGMVRLL